MRLLHQESPNEVLAQMTEVGSCNGRQKKTRLFLNFYLMTEQNNYLDMDLLRFTTAGSVDDGKSTLIGRLFHDTKAIFEDQLEAIEKSSKQRGDKTCQL